MSQKTLTTFSLRFPLEGFSLRFPQRFLHVFLQRFLYVFFTFSLRFLYVFFGFSRPSRSGGTSLPKSPILIGFGKDSTWETWVWRKSLFGVSRAIRLLDVFITFSLRFPPARLNVFFTFSVGASEQTENPKKTLTAFFGTLNIYIYIYIYVHIIERERRERERERDNMV